MKAVGKGRTMQFAELTERRCFLSNFASTHLAGDGPRLPSVAMASLVSTT